MPVSPSSQVNHDKGYFLCNVDTTIILEVPMTFEYWQTNHSKNAPLQLYAFSEISMSKDMLANKYKTCECTGFSTSTMNEIS